MVVPSRDADIPGPRRAIIAPCTTTIRGLPREVVLEHDDEPVPQTCTVNLDSVETVSIAMLTDRLGRLFDERVRQICGALTIAVGCDT